MPWTKKAPKADPKVISNCDTAKPLPRLEAGKTSAVAAPRFASAIMLHRLMTKKNPIFTGIVGASTKKKRHGTEIPNTNALRVIRRDLFFFANASPSAAPRIAPSTSPTPPTAPVIAPAFAREIVVVLVKYVTAVEKRPANATKRSICAMMISLRVRIERTSLNCLPIPLNVNIGADSDISIAGSVARSRMLAASLTTDMLRGPLILGLSGCGGSPFLKAVGVMF